MTFTNALSNALSGMTAATTAIQVRSSNIANATTPGYARRDLSLASGLLGGVRVDSVVRSEDRFLLMNRLSADARYADAEARAAAAEAINNSFGIPGDTNGLFSKISTLNSSLEDLASAPDSSTYQRNTLEATKDLAFIFNSLSDDVTTLRSEADRDIAATISDVNAALQALYSLNTSNERGLTNGLSNFAEQRQEHIDVIAEAFDISVTFNGSNQTRVTTGEGVVLLDDTVREINFVRGGIVAPGTRYENGDLSGISVDGIDLTPGAGPQSTSSGKIAGLFAVRDDIGVEFESQLDTLADDLISRFSGPSVDSTLGATDEGLFTGGGTLAGTASRISVNSAVDPSEGGALFRLRDGINATTAGPAAGEGVTRGLLAAVEENRTLSSVTEDPSSLSLIDTVAAFSSVVGTKRQNEAVAATSAAAAAQTFRDAELSAHGVNTDQELQSLLLIEQAYAANARVVQVVDDMLARLLEI